MQEPVAYTRSANRRTLMRIESPFSLSMPSRSLCKIFLWPIHHHPSQTSIMCRIYAVQKFEDTCACTIVEMWRYMAQMDHVDCACMSGCLYILQAWIGPIANGFICFWIRTASQAFQMEKGERSRRPQNGDGAEVFRMGRQCFESLFVILCVYAWPSVWAPLR